MSLSDDEERILSEMEAQLAESDPRLVDDVSSTTVYTAALSNIKWAVLIFIAGVVFMIFTLSIHFLLSALGFVIMLVALLILENSITKLGKAGISQMMQSAKEKGYMESFRSNMRTRFNKKKGTAS